MKPKTGAKTKLQISLPSHFVLQKYQKPPLSPVDICRGVFVFDKLAFTGISSRQSRFRPRALVPLSDGSLQASAAALDALQKPLQSMENAGSTSQLPWVRQRLFSQPSFELCCPGTTALPRPRLLGRSQLLISAVTRDQASICCLFWCCKPPLKS